MLEALGRGARGDQAPVPARKNGGPDLKTKI